MIKRPPHIYWSRSFLETASIKTGDEEHIPVLLTGYVLDDGNLATLTINGKTPENLVKNSDRFWQFDIEVSENGTFTILAVDNAGNRTVIVDWFNDEIEEKADIDPPPTPKGEFVDKDGNPLDNKSLEEGDEVYLKVTQPNPIPDDVEITVIRVSVSKDGTGLVGDKVTPDENGPYKITSNGWYILRCMEGDKVEGDWSQIILTMDAFKISATPNGGGNMTISKTVTGKGDTDREFTFIVTLTDAAGKPLVGSYPYTGSKSGEIANGDSIKLKHGESVTIIGLPIGVQYTVAEAESNQDGYTTTAENASGYITEDSTVTASFVNDKADDSILVPTMTSITVNKVWDDNESAERPEFVTVQLYQNGVPYGNTIRLSKANSWLYTWDGLSNYATWTVKEVDVPKGYDASVSFSGKDWTITNTKRGNEETPPDESKPDILPDEPKPDTPSITDTSNNKMPSTGDNNNLEIWITLMAVSIIGIAVVFVFYRKKKRRTEK